jgi:hypothetical protein
MFSTSSSDLRCFLNWKRSNWKGNSRVSSSHRDVGASNTESIDRISNIMDSLQNSIGIHILIAAMGNTKSILGLHMG